MAKGKSSKSDSTKASSRPAGRGAEVKVPKLGLYWPDKRTVVDKTILPFQVVEVVNVPKAEREREPLFYGQGAKEKSRVDAGRNKLIWGDNKWIMSSLLPEFAGRIDLIYIDPPFATGADFSYRVKVEGEEWVKEASVIEERAYRDTWGKGLDSYLQMMYDRLVLMRELLSETGSIYVHLDWHVGHYVKLVMDELFGKECFRNMLVWYYGGRGGKAISGQFARDYDMLLLYSKGENPLFNKVYTTVRIPVDEALTSGFRKDEKGRWFSTAPRGNYTDESVAELRREGRIHETRSGTVRIKYFKTEKDGYILEEK